MRWSSMASRSLTFPNTFLLTDRCGRRIRTCSPHSKSRDCIREAEDGGRMNMSNLAVESSDKRPNSFMATGLAVPSGRLYEHPSWCFTHVGCGWLSRLSAYLGELEASFQRASSGSPTAISRPTRFLIRSTHRKCRDMSPVGAYCLSLRSCSFVHPWRNGCRQRRNLLLRAASISRGYSGGCRRGRRQHCPRGASHPHHRRVA